MARNRIIEQQNTPEHVELFAAASYYYGWGKVTLAVQMIMTIGIAIALSIIVKLNPDAKAWTTFTAITITWLDILVLDRVQIFFRKRGALVQEQNDCGLFGLEWNELRCGKPLEGEDVHSGAACFLRCHDDSKLRNWYPSSVEELPLPLARLICQRCCFRWDMSLRRLYRLSLIGLVVLGSISAVAFALYRGLLVEDLILAVYAPLAPAVIWCMREVRRQGDAADSLDKARGYVEAIWKQALSGKLDTALLEVTGRRIQDTLFENRSKNPPMFNWIYDLKRDEKELTMVKMARKMVDDAVRAGV
jgi:hypothetical protein